EASSGVAGRKLHIEMEMLVESGRTPIEALKSATGWGSSALLTSRRKPVTKPPVGVLAEGAYADLVVLNANPLDNIANSRKIDRVMKGGQFVKPGYTANYGRPRNPVALILRIPEPEISAVIPASIQGTTASEIHGHG